MSEEKTPASFAIQFLETLKKTTNLNKKNLLVIENVLKQKEVSKEELAVVEKIVVNMRQANTMVVEAIDNIIKSHYKKN